MGNSCDWRCLARHLVEAVDACLQWEWIRDDAFWYFQARDWSRFCCRMSAIERKLDAEGDETPAAIREAFDVLRPQRDLVDGREPFQAAATKAKHHLNTL